MLVDAKILDKDVWRKKHQTSHGVARSCPVFWRGSCTDQGDRSAVAVADQDWVLDAELREQIWQRPQGLVVHVTYRARLGEDVGVARAVARIDGDGTSRCGGDARGKIPPVRDRAEPFMEEDEFRRVLIDSGNAQHFKAAALYRDVEDFSPVQGAVSDGGGFKRLH